MKGKKRERRSHTNRTTPEVLKSEKGKETKEGRKKLKPKSCICKKV